MNFLAHLHLASLAESSLPGNLIADFVRGDPYQNWPENIASGIVMHRRIDAWTDALPQVRLARSWFHASTRRVAPVALDIFWDHFLSLHWQRIQPDVSLTQFVSLAQASVMPLVGHSPPGFQQLNHYLWSERWMERYAQPEFIRQVLDKMALRRPRLVALRDTWSDFNQNYQELEKIFWDFYPEMVERSLKQQW